ncbi:ABC transporter substrate-binding protein [Brockia lithotrophica]|uniref:Iron complex transport system substrate-binding protein n=1 Tax=Brockia lithotrophica TaxID=933949 RepID=A0A660LA48_9BACL|nr:ABC transporter substrate-binding protein [Brockia lithotrophica]RKQ88440.1 iron complex transport system substrate-binding protein [Brockia lithotrophica]
MDARFGFPPRRGRGHWSKFVSGFAAAWIALFALVGCGGKSQPQAETPPSPTAPATRTIVDQLGREVSVPADVRRIVLLPMPMPSVIFAIDGGGGRIVGMHPTAMKAYRESTLKDIDPALAQVPTNFVQEGFTVNLEELLKLRPDVVIQWDDQKPEIEKMERAGLPVLAIHHGTQEDLEGWFRMVGKLLGKEERAEALVRYHEENLQAIRARTRDIPQERRPKVLLVYNETPRVAGKGIYFDVWMDAAGVRNAAEDLKGWQNVSMEQIYRMDPDILLISNFTDRTPEDFLNNRIEGQDWSQLRAVREGRVYKVPLVGYRWEPPNPESPLMMWWLGKLAHPNAFADVDVVAKVQEFYRDFYGYTISREEVVRRLHNVY